jgi:regulator of RNase E activity RraA
MSTRAKYLGVADIIVDGRTRSLDEQRALGYPVFGRGVGTAHPYESVKVAVVNVREASAPASGHVDQH